MLLFLRFFKESLLEQFFYGRCCVKTAFCAVSDADAAVAAADKKESFVVFQFFVNGGNTLQVADGIFGHAFEPAVNFEKDRFRPDAGDFSQFFQNGVEEFRVAERYKLFVMPATDKTPDEEGVFR